MNQSGQGGDPPFSPHSPKTGILTFPHFSGGKTDMALSQPWLGSGDEQFKSLPSKWFLRIIL
jgi:hypothetical protein